MVKGETSEYFERGMILETPSARRTASVPLYDLTYSMSSSVVSHSKTCGSLDGGTIKLNIIESPCVNLLDVVLRVRRMQ